MMNREHIRRKKKERENLLSRVRMPLFPLFFFNDRKLSRKGLVEMRFEVREKLVMVFGVRRNRNSLRYNNVGLCSRSLPEPKAEHMQTTYYYMNQYTSRSCQSNCDSMPRTKHKTDRRSTRS